ncbi:hypothetical protein CROQUDRAFT_674341 [Cronartium quercuum f. sp. fusiforme G11]|uniref:Nucleotide-sugar transporter n=1 Tax=Cronartium quercuum f. sp. fusiforme G11 TaxID=708437 RepID=A0A9P6NBY5_9BASI|nr:hypothetical protein CROQUDRAFT_674341 [Cronartium quercuum f. sp. fusiforme G11]
MITLKSIISRDCWKLSIPAILYVIQNNLQFVAATNLDVATFSVTYQLKILTTALCSVIILGRKLSGIKWISLLCLAIGVALVQLKNNTNHQDPDENQRNPLKGFIAVSLACFTSGLAGVYFELVLKSSNMKIDLWMRNVQLSLFSIFPAILTFIFTSTNLKFFNGFNIWTWSTILTQVLGGLITALVIKFADNILKGFSTSLSIILSSILSYIFFKDHSSFCFIELIGISLVLFSTYTYNLSTNSNNSIEPIENVLLNKSNKMKDYDDLDDKHAHKIEVKPLPLTHHLYQPPHSPSKALQTSITSPHTRNFTFLTSSSSSNDLHHDQIILINRSSNE